VRQRGTGGADDIAVALCVTHRFGTKEVKDVKDVKATKGPESVA